MLRLTLAAGVGWSEIKAALDENIYPTKQKVSDAELAAIKIVRHEFHGEWNYYISP